MNPYYLDSSMGRCFQFRVLFYHYYYFFFFFIFSNFRRLGNLCSLEFSTSVQSDKKRARHLQHLHMVQLSNDSLHPFPSPPLPQPSFSVFLGHSTLLNAESLTAVSVREGEAITRGGGGGHETV